MVDHHTSHERELIEVQVRAIVDQPGRLYDLIHALIEECYRRAERNSSSDWQYVAMYLTSVERIAERMPHH